MALKAVVGAISCAKYVDRRDRCRQTWFGELARREGVKAFFVVGDEKRLAPELVDDTLFVPCSDSYRELPVKVHAFIRWTTENFPAEYIVKCDDDTYIQPDRFITCLDEGHIYTGKGMRGDYAGGGGGYILSANAADILAAEAKPTPGPEDVWVGRVLRDHGIRLRADARFEPGVNTFPTPMNRVITGHPLRDGRMVQVHIAFGAFQRSLSAVAAIAVKDAGGSGQTETESRYVVILSQGRSGGTLILRLLNTVPGVKISGENERAFDHLLRFAQTMERLSRHRHSPFFQLAWKAPCDNGSIVRHLRRFVTSTYGPGELVGFKEIRYGQEERYEDFSSAVGWLRELFPGLKIIFNTRNPETCVHSDWWAKDKVASRKILERMRANFERYHREHPSLSYWMPYEELQRGSAVLQGMFAFLNLSVRPEYFKPLDVVLK